MIFPDFSHTSIFIFFLQYLCSSRWDWDRHFAIKFPQINRLNSHWFYFSESCRCYDNIHGCGRETPLEWSTRENKLKILHQSDIRNWKFIQFHPTFNSSYHNIHKSNLLEFHVNFNSLFLLNEFSDVSSTMTTSQVIHNRVLAVTWCEKFFLVKSRFFRFDSCLDFLPFSCKVLCWT